MKTGGRPRKIRSKPTSGVGGREFTVPEKRALLSLGERYGLDVEDERSCNAFMERLWIAFGSFCAAEHALGQQVSVADELFDLETLLARAKVVEHLLRQENDLTDDQGCLRAAHALAESLWSFPNFIAAEISATADWQAFENSRRILESFILRVRFWAQYRTDLLHSLEVFIKTCERAPQPKLFTKRRRQGRDIFERELGDLYKEFLHPPREANWRDARDRVNDPPPPQSTHAFAQGVMRALGVKFETK